MRKPIFSRLTGIVLRAYPSRQHCLLGQALIVGAILLAGSAAHAAGEWEWTAGQGWIRGAGVARPTPKEQLHYAYQLERRSEFMDAAHQYFLLVQNFPASEEAGVGLQRLARCLFEMENYYTSYKAIEQVIETYPNTGRMSDLVEIELRIAKKMMVSQTPDLLSGREDRAKEHNIRRSLEILDSVIEHDPYGPVAAEAYLVKGEGHLFINEVQQARKSFETVRDEFPRSDFVERARLGILTCDSLLGQARPQEVQEQIEVVREMERERAQRYGDDDEEDMEEMDDVESSIRQLAEVEAAKMMEQAEQYRRMGTRKGVSSSEFLYKEIIRRYPGTIQADDAMARLGHLNVPKEKSRFSKAVSNITLNPFTYNKDPEPPWIVPQMDPADMVMVDAGLGPIAGVPESGDAPRTSYSAGVRPTGIGSSSVAVGQGDGESATVAGGRNFSPVSLSPGPAPAFIDGVAGKKTYSSDPDYDDEEEEDGPGQRRTSANPLPTIKDDDLILPPGMNRGNYSAREDGRQGGQGVRTPPAFPGDDYYAVNATYGDGPLRAPNMPNPSLGSPVDIPYSDLVGMPQQGMGYGQGGGGYQQPYGQQQYGGQYGQYGDGYNTGNPYQNQNRSGPRESGGWTFGDDLR